MESQKEKKEKGTQAIFEVTMTKTSLKLKHDEKSQMQKVQRTPRQINVKKLYLFKLQKIKDKENILKEARKKKKYLTSRGAKIRIIYDFPETMQVREN